MRRSRRALLMALATACVLALGGCSEEEKPEEVLRTSGPLAAGFEIEPGSGLVGAVFPVLSSAEGQLVVLRVDGDVQRVFAGYVQQAADLGLPLAADYGTDQGCTDPGDATDGDPADPYEVECGASGFQPDVWQVSVRGLAEPDGQGYIHLDSRRF